jgi:hypothetical protein
VTLGQRGLAKDIAELCHQLMELDSSIESFIHQRHSYTVIKMHNPHSCGDEFKIPKPMQRKLVDYLLGAMQAAKGEMIGQIKDLSGLLSPVELPSTEEQ